MYRALWDSCSPFQKITHRQVSWAYSTCVIPFGGFGIRAHVYTWWHGGVLSLLGSRLRAQGCWDSRLEGLRFGDRSGEGHYRWGLSPVYGVGAPQRCSEGPGTVEIVERGIC